MKKKLFLLLSALFLSLSLGACHSKRPDSDKKEEETPSGDKTTPDEPGTDPVDTKVDVTSVVVSPSTLSLYVGDSETLRATVLPENATDKTITWSTSDASIATVNNGTVTAVKAGEVTISAKAGEKTGTCVVTVSNKTTPTPDPDPDPDPDPQPEVVNFKLAIGEGTATAFAATTKEDIKDSGDNIIGAQYVAKLNNVAAGTVLHFYDGENEIKPAASGEGNNAVINDGVMSVFSAISEEQTLYFKYYFEDSYNPGHPGYDVWLTGYVAPVTPKAENVTLKVVFPTAVPEYVDLYFRSSINEWGGTKLSANEGRTEFTTIIPEVNVGEYEYKVTAQQKDSELSWDTCLVIVSEGDGNAKVTIAEEENQVITLKTFEENPNFNKFNPDAQVEVTLSVTFAETVPEYVSICIPGDFNSWGETLANCKMTRGENNKTFTIIVNGEKGAKIEFKVVAIYANATKLDWNHKILTGDLDANLSYTLPNENGNESIGDAVIYDFATNLPDLSDGEVVTYTINNLPDFIFNDDAAVFAGVVHADGSWSWEVVSKTGEKTATFSAPDNIVRFLVARCYKGTTQPSWEETGDAVGRVYNQTTGDIAVTKGTTTYEASEWKNYP